MPIMSEKKSYAPGEFCWTELATGDWKAAKEFYTSLFGWTAEEMPMGDQPPYVMLKKNGKGVGALYENRKARPGWLAYVAVAKVDDAAKKAKSLGAKTLQEPFDVMDVGRMVNIEDPQGAKFALWEAKKHKGADIINEPGAMCWNELYSPDIKGSQKFYSGLFNWKLKVSPEYTEIHMTDGDQGIGGMMQLSPEMQGMPPMWMPYFAVADCDASANKAKSLGGQLHVGPQDIPKVGRFAILGDTQDAGFAIISLAR